MVKYLVPHDLFNSFFQSAPKEVEISTNDTSTFIAATSDETLGAGNQLMARRAANVAEKPDTLTKEVRRDSKGFENFDDYFEESDGNDTTINTAGEKTNDESIGDDSVTEVKNVIKTLKIILIFVKYLLKKIF